MFYYKANIGRFFWTVWLVMFPYRKKYQDNFRSVTICTKMNCRKILVRIQIYQNTVGLKLKLFYTIFYLECKPVLYFWGIYFSYLWTLLLWISNVLCLRYIFGHSSHKCTGPVWILAGKSPCITSWCLIYPK